MDMVDTGMVDMDVVDVDMVDMDEVDLPSPIWSSFCWEIPVLGFDVAGAPAFRWKQDDQLGEHSEVLSLY